MRATLNAFASLLVTLALTQRLDKPPLEPNLNFLATGFLQSLPSVKNSYTQWPRDWIPVDCESMVENANLSAIDVEVFNVTYDDCPNDPWILCRHTDSPDPVTDMIDVFGRVPVGARQWVRHIINLPDPRFMTWAYNMNGNIAIYAHLRGDPNIFIHETAHSLDLLGAYTAHPLSTSAAWSHSYATDSHVPDPYSQINQRENLAETTVMAAYELNVPGGLSPVAPGWHGVQHQIDTIEAEQKKQGNLLSVKQGKGECTKRLENSQVVKVKGRSRVRVRVEPPDVRLSEGVHVIEPVAFDTTEACRRD